VNEIRTADLESLALGASLLGCGGGGDPHIGRRMAEKALRVQGPVPVLAVSEVPPDAWVVCVSGIGAPDILGEKVPSGREPAAAVRRLSAFLGRTPFAVLPAEIGGVNALLPLLAAAELGLPVVDADGTGRAFPALYMETMHVRGVSGTPACFASENGDVVLLDRLRDNFSYERLARGITDRLGGHAFVADYPLTGAELRRAVIPGTLSLTLGIGRALLDAQGGGGDPLGAILTAAAAGGYESGRHIFTGRVVQVLRRSVHLQAQGAATLGGLAGDAGSVLRLDFQNEYLRAARDGERIAVTPDLIALLDAHSGLPISTERLRYGQHVAVLSIPAPPDFKTPEALAVWGPQAFGYD
jgi:DUF917 family protein